VIALLPVPPGLELHAWRYFAVFAALIIALITEPIPSAALGLITITFVAVTGLVFTPEQLASASFRPTTEAVRWALSGFGSGTVWLIFAAFVFSMGYEKSGLGRRIALLLVKRLGGRTLGLGYAIALADTVLAPFTPSNTARSAGTIFPVIRNIPALYGSGPGPSARRIGSYLMWVAFATTCVTSTMFLTALAPNLLALELIRQATGLHISWGQWLIGFLPAGILLLASLPWLIYKVHPPEIRSGSEVPAWAAGELTRMGRVTRSEFIMGALVLIALALWIFGGRVIHATTVALVAISLMLVTRVVTWEDILGNKPAWNVLTWFATLIVLADGLNKVGFVGWFGQGAASLLAGLSPGLVMILLVAIFFLIHYMFASITAHTTAVLPVILAAGIAVPDMPVRTFALLLAYTLGIMGVLTPYATGPAPVYYGSGFIARKDFWRLGFIFGMLFLVTILALVRPWLGFLAP
jgi:L-tartrate/succinate antiporter